MTMPLSPQEIQELAAGYVLGDLTSNEAELFQTLLAELPTLGAEVTALQDALAVMPYGLADVDMAVEVRSQLLAKAERELHSQSAPVPVEVPKTVSERFMPDRSKPAPNLTQGFRLQRRLFWMISGVAAGLAIAYGLTTLRLSHELRVLQTRSEPSTAQDSMVHTWSGLDDILQDHRKSLDHPEGPVDFVVGKPSDLIDLLSGFQTTVATLPLLPQGQLIGGSNCQFGKTPGLRLTYQLSSNQTVSAYQLPLSEQSIAQMPSTQISFQQQDGTSMVLWRDGSYLYALVATLPLPELQTLARSVNGTPNVAPGGRSSL